MFFFWTHLSCRQNHLFHNSFYFIFFLCNLFDGLRILFQGCGSNHYWNNFCWHFWQFRQDSDSVAATIPKNYFRSNDEIDTEAFLLTYDSVIMRGKNHVAKAACLSTFLGRETFDVSVKFHNRLDAHQQKQKLWLCVGLADWPLFQTCSSRRVSRDRNGHSPWKKRPG